MTCAREKLELLLGPGRLDGLDPVGIAVDRTDLLLIEENLTTSESTPLRNHTVLTPAPEGLTRHPQLFQKLRNGEVGNTLYFNSHAVGTLPGLRDVTSYHLM